MSNIILPKRLLLWNQTIELLLRNNIFTIKRRYNKWERNWDLHTITITKNIDDILNILQNENWNNYLSNIKLDFNKSLFKNDEINIYINFENKPTIYFDDNIDIIEILPKDINNIIDYLTITNKNENNTILDQQEDKIIIKNDIAEKNNDKIILPKDIKFTNIKIIKKKKKKRNDKKFKIINKIINMKKKYSMTDVIIYLNNLSIKEINILKNEIELKKEIYNKKINILKNYFDKILLLKSYFNNLIDINNEILSFYIIWENILLFKEKRKEILKKINYWYKNIEWINKYYWKIYKLYNVYKKKYNFLNILLKNSS